MTTRPEMMCGRIIVEFYDQDVFAQTVDKVIGSAAEQRSTAPHPAVSVGHPSSPPPVADPIDKQILAWVIEDPDLTDTQIGQRLDMSRQAANARRRRLQLMGYQVR